MIMNIWNMDECALLSYFSLHVFQILGVHYSAEQDGKDVSYT